MSKAIEVASSQHQIGSDLTAKATPDGYTILIVPGSHAINPSVYKKLPYDTIKDFSPISLIGGGAYVVVVNPDLPVRTAAVAKNVSARPARRWCRATRRLREGWKFRSVARERIPQPGRPAFDGGPAESLRPVRLRSIFGSPRPEPERAVMQ